MQKRNQPFRNRDGRLPAEFPLNLHVIGSKRFAFKRTESRLVFDHRPVIVGSFHQAIQNKSDLRRSSRTNIKSVELVRTAEQGRAYGSDYIVDVHKVAGSAEIPHPDLWQVAMVNQFDNSGNHMRIRFARPIYIE